MNIEPLREVHKARPFQAFTLHLADGNEVRVPHPEFIWFHPKNARTAIVGLPNGAFKIIDLLLVVSIEVGNGKARRRKR